MKIIITENQLKNIITEITGNEEKIQGFFDVLQKVGDVGRNIENFYSDIGQISQQNIPTDNQLSKNINLNKFISTDKKIIFPVKGNFPITSKFGRRQSRMGTKQHKGIDIGAPSGTEVISPSNGVVISAKDSSPNPCGGFIHINHGDFQTKYCHLREINVKAGDNIIKGQVIGYSGGGPNDPHKGTSTGAHLHFSILNSSGVPIDPLNLFKNNLGTI